MKQKVHKEWVTQQQLASELLISCQAVDNWIKRKKIDFKVQKPSGITLVDKNSIRVRGYEKSTPKGAK